MQNEQQGKKSDEKKSEKKKNLAKKITQCVSVARAEITGGSEVTKSSFLPFSTKNLSFLFGSYFELSPDVYVLFPFLEHGHKGSLQKNTGLFGSFS